MDGYGGSHHHHYDPYAYPPPPNQPYPPPPPPNQSYPPPPPNQPYPPPPSHINGDGYSTPRPYPQPESHPYPPPPSHINGDGYSTPRPYPQPESHPYPYPQPESHPYPYPQPEYQYPGPYGQPNYPKPSPRPRPTSYSGPLLPHHQSFHHSGSFQHSSSFSHGSSHHQYSNLGRYPPPSPNTDPNAQFPGRVDSFSSVSARDNWSGGLVGSTAENSLESKPLNGSSYPPLEGIMSDLQLSDHRPSAPALPTAPSLSVNDNLAMVHQSSSGEFSHQGSSLLSNKPSWDGSFSSRSDFIAPYSPNLEVVPYQTGSLRVLLLHGNLDIWIYGAKNLPNMDMFHRTFSDMISKLPGNAAGQVTRKITSDPYVSITVSSAVLARTYVISNEENPVWMQHFNVPVAHHAAEVHFLVKDSDVVGSQLMGSVSIPVDQIYSGAKVEGTYPILNANGKQCKTGAVLSISIQYTPMKNLSIYHHGVGAGPDYQGVPGTYFPLRRGGKVTLYQDAHVPDGCLPEFTLDRGRKYVHGKCWQDIVDAIRKAQRLIYITGWSIWHQVRLVRDSGDHSSECTLGELLRSKSAEGARVLLLVWDDPTSRSILGYRTDGIMATHDEEIRRFFKNSTVKVQLCPRIAGKRHSWVKQRETSTIYTHHQKTVIVDADTGTGDYRKKIIAFVGGLDLCDGRYDTPHHPLFRTLQTLHKDDYHNPSYQGNTTGCPREPWHDLHCKIDGPAAYDILTNFEDRWRKASKPHGIKKLKKKTIDDDLLRLERLSEICGISDAPWLSEDDPESWHVQVFRSIDSNSVKGFPKDPKEATTKNLMCGKNVLIDMSIHTAYVKAIRAAQHYIYIENQYFIGSSYNWTSHKDLGANNLIPMEIALKIAEKIRAHERFAAYIVIPMWPEGVPSGAATQRILYWQNKTMQMMYETIYKALVEVGLDDKYTPQDYLNFFCLGNREASDSSPAVTPANPHPPNTPQALCQKNRRFMIYVHSKGMIVDDEYVIIGSANINQRSMEGTRDTEIAMGAYQPHYTWARKLGNPRGQIYGYRMSLWTEHLGLVDDSFNRPESIECVRKVRTLSETYWSQFASENVTEMKGHLLKYPVYVDQRGKVKPLPGSENFPDLGGSICGSFIAIQENLTI